MPSELYLPPPSSVGSLSRRGSWQFFPTGRRESLDRGLGLMEPPVNINSSSALPSPVSLPSPRVFEFYEKTSSSIPRLQSPKPLESRPHVLKPLEIPARMELPPSSPPLPRMSGGIFHLGDSNRTTPTTSDLSQTASTANTQSHSSVDISNPNHRWYRHPSPHGALLPSPPMSTGTVSHLPSPQSGPIDTMPNSPPMSDEECTQTESRKGSKAASSKTLGTWQKWEDDRLLQGVKLYGAKDWKYIAALVGNRTTKQCRERYNENLAPHLSHEKASPEEIHYIMHLVAHMGTHWAKIAQKTKNRSPNFVKNLYHSQMGRRTRDEKRKRQAAVVAARNHYTTQTAQLPLPSPIGSYSPRSASHLPPLSQLPIPQPSGHDTQWQGSQSSYSYRY